MNDRWSKSTFGDIATLLRDSVKPSEVEPDLPYLGLEHFAEGGGLLGHGVAADSTSVKSQFRAGDILYGKLRPYFRKFAVAPFDGVCSTEVWVLRPKGEVPYGYLLAVVGSERFTAYAMAGAGGTRMPRASWDHVSTLSLDLPPRPEQQAIADLFLEFDRLITLNERLRDLCDEMGRTLITSALDVAGQSWPEQTLESVTSVIETGKRPKGGVGKYKSGVPSIGAESVDGLGRYEFARTKYVPEEFAASMRRGVLQSHDVLIYKDGGKPGEFRAHVGMFGNGFPYEEMTINEHVYRVRANPKTTEAYLYFWLSTPEMLAAMGRLGTGAAIPGLNSTALKSLRIPLPPSALAEPLHEALRSLADEGLLAAKEARRLAETRDALTAPLLDGTLEIGDAK